MVVIPTSHDVSMVYGVTPMLTIGNIITDVTVLAEAVTLYFYIRRRVSARRGRRTSSSSGDVA